MGLLTATPQGVDTPNGRHSHNEGETEMARKPTEKQDMNLEEFCQIQEDLGATNRELAELLNTTERSVENWRRGTRGIPGPVAKLLKIQAASLYEEVPVALLRERLTKCVHAFEAIIRNDKTRYQHHEPRPSDGKTPREVDGGTCFLAPREIAEMMLKELGPEQEAAA